MSPVFIYTLACLGGIGFLLGALLQFASKQFVVEIDPRIEQVLDIFPGANCGGCGYAGCAVYAEAIVRDGAEANLCAPGGSNVIREIAQFLGLEGTQAVRKIPYLHCAGSRDNAKDKYIYDGINDCRIVALLAGGHKACDYRCSYRGVLRQGQCRNLWDIYNVQE